MTHVYIIAEGTADIRFVRTPSEFAVIDTVTLSALQFFQCEETAISRAQATQQQNAWMGEPGRFAVARVRQITREQVDAIRARVRAALAVA
ncbi:MAG: hypothetical protein ACOYB0_08325 [Polynucleobacter sp.]